jgi:AcrR family transcriptional regulator
METNAKKLTRKGQETRQHILDTAIGLFARQGYETTTMRDIAAAADCSLGLAYRYFTRKEDLVLALYQDLAAQSEANAQALKSGLLADRFQQTMLHKLEQVTPYRETLSALLGAVMNPKTEIAVLGTGTTDIRDRMTEVFKHAILGATDAPKESQAAHLASLLYSTHLLILLFWLYDRTPDQQATYNLVQFGRDTLALTRPFLLLPPVAKSLARLAGILEAVFGGAGT